jgi:hypothetical protein
MLMTLSGFCLIRVEVEAEDWEELFRLELLEELELDIRREKVSLKKKNFKVKKVIFLNTIIANY